ncbi:MAG: acetylxylan esterase [Ruthenibacterium sp.]
MSENNTQYRMEEKPENFDSFWDLEVEKLKQLPAKYTLATAPFVSPIANCFDLCFESFDKSKIHAQYLRPKCAVKAKTPVLLMFHGYTWNAGSYAQKLQYVSLGYSVLAMDCRGQSGASADNACTNGNTVFGHILRGIEGNAENLYYFKTFLDTAMLAQIALSMEETDSTKLCTLGDSQGGALSLVCAALVPHISRTVCYYPFLCNYALAVQQPSPTAYDEILQYFKRADPLHLKEKEVFRKLAYIDVRFFVNRIKAEVLWLQGAKDTQCPPITQAQAFEDINSKKEMLIYPEYGHEIMPDSYDRIYAFLQRPYP